MRILGIDPGIGRCGWGIIEAKGNKQIAISYGCIETDKDLPLDTRLEQLFDQVTKIIKTEKPESFAIEDLFFNTNAKTAMVVGQARGVILLAAVKAKLPIGIYTPLQVKMAVTGYGRADKNQMGQMIKVLLKLDKIPKLDDTADALAVAITHAFSNKFEAQNKKSETMSKYK